MHKVNYIINSVLVITSYMVITSYPSSSSNSSISLVPHAVLLMPLRGHTGHEMHPRGFTVSEKAA